MSDDSKTAERLERIVEVLVRYAARDFSARVPISDDLDTIDAIGVGLNMMSEELDGAVVSRSELERAYSELKETQVKLIHAAKLASIGQLASGVAHEVNNPAAWVGISLEIARKKIAQLREQIDAIGDDAARAALGETVTGLVDVVDRAHEGVGRIRNVVGDLRTFSQSDDAMDLVLLDDVVRATCNLIEPAVRSHARLVLHLGDVPAVRGHRGRLGQVVTNLVVNASQAIEESGVGGRIDVVTAKAGEGVALTVEDDGPGIADDLHEKIFDPFFTTRPLGTGLGLSLVAEIAARHGGHLRVHRPPVGGARLELWLPIATK